MHPVLTLIGWIALCCGLVGGIYALVAAALVGRFMKAPAPSASSTPPVTLLKPLSGAEAGLAESLESFCRQAYAGEMQIVFGVQDPADPAIAVVQALQAARPQAAIELVVDATEHGANRKVSNLINIARRARHDILIVSDSDMTAPSDYVSRIIGALESPGVGVVTLLYVGQARRGLWSRLGAMAINYQFLPNAVLGSSLGLAEPCMGSTIALRAETLRRIGGFEAFRDHLADDYEIGRAARALGYRIAMPPLVLGHACGEASAGALMDQEIRWGRTIRLIDGAGYYGTLVTHGLPMAVIGATLLGFSDVSLALLLAILVSRLILKRQVDAATGTRAGSYWLVPLRDVLSFAVFLASLAGASVSWRGRRYRVGPDGVLAPI